MLNTKFKWTWINTLNRDFSIAWSFVCQRSEGFWSWDWSTYRMPLKWKNTCVKHNLKVKNKYGIAESVLETQIWHYCWFKITKKIKEPLKILSKKGVSSLPVAFVNLNAYTHTTHWYCNIYFFKLKSVPQTNVAN